MLQEPLHSRQRRHSVSKARFNVLFLVIHPAVCPASQTHKFPNAKIMPLIHPFGHTNVFSVYYEQDPSYVFFFHPNHWVFFGVVETIVDSFLCCVVGIVSFVLSHLVIAPDHNTMKQPPKLNCFSLNDAPIKNAAMLPSQAPSVLVLELIVLGLGLIVL